MTKTITEYAWRKWASCSGPERTDPSKRGLLAPPMRARRLKRWARRERVDVFGLFESGTVMRGAVARNAAWSAHYGDPNTVLGPHEIGNGIIVRAALVADTREAADVRVPMFRRRPLTFPAFDVAFENVDTKVATVVAHLPRRLPQYLAARRRAVKALRRLVANLRRRGYLVVVTIDANGRPPKIEGLRVVARHAADSILASVELRARRGRSHDRTKGILRGTTDHDPLTVEIGIPFERAA